MTIGNSINQLGTTLKSVGDFSQVTSAPDTMSPGLEDEFPVKIKDRVVMWIYLWGIISWQTLMNANISLTNQLKFYLMLQSI